MANDRDRRSIPEDPRGFSPARFEQASALDLVDGRERGSALDLVSARDDESAREVVAARADERDLISAREQAALRGLVPERDSKRAAPGSRVARDESSERSRGPQSAREPDRDRARSSRQPVSARDSERERTFREQQAAREEILNRGQSWAREQAAARAKALREQPREPAVQKPAKGGVVEERAARTRADPRRDPTHPQQSPMQALPERGARRPDEVIRPPREGRSPANVHDPRVEPEQRVSIPPTRTKEPAQGSGPQRTAAKEIEGRRYPSHQGGSAPEPRSSARPEVGRFPSQTGGNAPAPRAPASVLEGRKFPSQHGANAPVPRTPAPDGRRYPSQQGASAPAAREASNRAAPPSRNPAPPAALSGAPVSQRPDSLYCEIDRLAVEIQLQDLSAGGLFVQTPAPPPIDGEVEVFLQIGALRIEASGHVVQSLTGDRAKRERRRPGFGLLFTRLDDNTRNALRDALDAVNSARAEPADDDYDFSRPKTNPGFEAPAPAAPTTRRSAQPVRSNEPPARTPAAAGSEAAEAAPRQPARPTATPAPVDPKEHELLAQLRAELASVESQPPWTVLGISQGADLAAARTAFFAASKRYHPHSYARYALPEIKAVVTQLFIVYKRAFTTMTKSGRGGRNARAAGSGNPPHRSSDPGNR